MSLRVLVVDDNVDAAESLRLILSLWGYETRSARSGRQALELAAGFRPDVALLDLGMPGMDGFRWPSGSVRAPTRKTSS
jgi:CheY-like chemotaxis protein